MSSKYSVFRTPIGGVWTLFILLALSFISIGILATSGVKRSFSSTETAYIVSTIIVLSTIRVEQLIHRRLGITIIAVIAWSLIGAALFLL